MVKDIAIAVISSACVGLATIAGTVWINQDNIGDLKEEIKDLQTTLQQQDSRLWEVKLDLAVLNGKISPASANRLSSLSSEEVTILESELQATDSIIPSSEAEPSASPELQEIVESNQLTKMDLENYSSLMKSDE